MTPRDYSILNVYSLSSPTTDMDYCILREKSLLAPKLIWGYHIDAYLNTRRLWAIRYKAYNSKEREREREIVSYFFVYLKRGHRTPAVLNLVRPGRLVQQLPQQSVVARSLGGASHAQLW